MINKMTAVDVDELLQQAFIAEESGEIISAIKLFKRASRYGSNDARSKLGTIYSDVLSPPNYRQAIYWYKKGVDEGDSSCAWNLAMLNAGLGKRRGYEQWLKVVSRMGDPDAKREIETNYWWQKRNAVTEFVG